MTAFGGIEATKGCNRAPAPGQVAWIKVRKRDGIWSEVEGGRWPNVVCEYSAEREVVCEKLREIFKVVLEQPRSERLKGF